MESTIEYYRNIVCFFVSSLVSINIFYHHFIDNNSLYISLPFLYSYFLFDMPFSRLDILMHHIFGLCLITPIFLLHISFQDINFLLFSIYKTEISTFFLLFKLWNKDNYIVTRYNLPPKLFIVNDLLFFALFFKLRILDYYNEIIINPISYSVIGEYSKNMVFGGAMAYTGIYGLFLLNLYWFCIMCKVAFKVYRGNCIQIDTIQQETHTFSMDKCIYPPIKVKPLIKSYSKKSLEIMAEKILSYTYFANIFIAGYVYSYSPSPSNIYDMIGITTLSMFSYNYHNDEYKMLVEIPSSNTGTEHEMNGTLFYSYMKDKLAIHFRSFLCILTSRNFDIGSSWHLSSREVVSTILHINSFLLAMLYIYANYSKNTSALFIDFRKPSKESSASLVLNIIISVPILYDSLLVINGSNVFSAKMNALLVTCLIGLVLKMQIFYEMNHVAFHILLMAQTYCLSVCNLRTNCSE